MKKLFFWFINIQHPPPHPPLYGLWLLPGNIYIYMRWKLWDLADELRRLARLHCKHGRENRTLSLAAFIRVPFTFHLSGAILWFWSWLCLTFSSPWVTEIPHSVSLYPQTPAVSLNQKRRQPRRRQTHKERQSVFVGVQRQGEGEGEGEKVGKQRQRRRSDQSPL